ncbi:FAD-dependent oxidoreductase [Streptomyces sp. NPDC048636]|uniref:NAD(P)/FAD-dependent oxidoreductase n=1 Tax=Streptomyces sp. NPDC048636 TaxID=3155762 RepID=UPI00344693F2
MGTARHMVTGGRRPGQDGEARRTAHRTDRTRGAWGHAVVIGAGFTGLLAARVLSARFARVTVVERDRLPPGTTHRSGLPQGRHPHGLLARGADIVEELFPGIRGDLAARGAPVFDFGSGFATRLPHGWAPRATVGVEAQSFDLTALESALCDRVRALPQVRFRDGFAVEGLELSADRRRAVAVLGRGRGCDDPDRAPVRIGADLVVDAGGRTSRLPAWLAAAGLPRPEERRVASPLVYSSRMYELPEGEAPEWLVSFEMTFPPLVSRGGAAITVDGTHRLVSLVAPAGQLPPPRDDAALREFAGSLRNPHFADVMTHSRPTTPAYRCPVGGNHWIRYHRLRRCPDRLLVLGDAFCAFNPVYGQGLTVAALQARLLGRLLAGAAAPAGIARRFQRHAARIVLFPWLTATAADQGWSAAPPPPVARCVRRFLDTVMRRAPENPVLYAHFVRVQNMLVSPLVLLRPSLLRHLLRRTPRAGGEARAG